jgi:predicted transcriptional regulator
VLVAGQSYGDRLRRLCDPGRDTELDDRLKGVYGRLHVQAFKLASLFAALDWLDTDDKAPTVTADHWHAGEAIAEGWRESAHRLLEQLDRSGEAVQEKRHQDRMLRSIRTAGASGVGLRDLYRNLNFSAKQARQIAGDLVKAGLIEERRLNRAEWFVAVEHVGEQP